MGLAERLTDVRNRMAQAAQRAGRDPAEVELVAVSKGHPPEIVIEAAQLGLTVFGENKVQEAKVKIPACPGRLRWHMIGHLQTNKCRDAAGLFTAIESVDSLRVAEAIQDACEKRSRRMPVLIEVNVAGEAAKFGYPPAAMLEELDRLNQLDRLEIQGLMAMAPYSPDPERARPVFRRLRELREQAQQKLGAPLAHLSMGMSGDFEVAIEEGATLVRIGTALFGERVWRPRG